MLRRSMHRQIKLAFHQLLSERLVRKYTTQIKGTFSSVTRDGQDRYSAGSPMFFTKSNE